MEGRPLTPTARSLTLLRRRGYLADVVERWIPRANIRRDLFGCIDLAAVCLDAPGVLGIQATTEAHVSTRLAKARALPALKTWLAAGNRFEVWGWTRRGRRWRVKIVAVVSEDLAAVVVDAPPRRRSGRKWHPLPLFDAEEVNTPAPDAADAG
jgi:hypothetical protein